VAGAIFTTWQMWLPAMNPKPRLPSAAAVISPAPAPVATANPPSAIDINALLTSNSANTTEASAFRRLLALWGTALTGDRDPCGQASKAGLACLDQRGSWGHVR